MSRGKYSPFRQESQSYDFNAFGKVPIEWSAEIAASGAKYDEKTMFGNYDEYGYDIYGYSAFDENGQYVGIGEGVDRSGRTELDYIRMSDDDFDDIIYHG